MKHRVHGDEENIFESICELSRWQIVEEKKII